MKKLIFVFIVSLFVVFFYQKEKAMIANLFNYSKNLQASKEASLVDIPRPESLSLVELTHYPPGFEKEFQRNFQKFFYINLENHTPSLKRKEKMERFFSDPLYKLTHIPAVFGKAIDYNQHDDSLQEIILPNKDLFSYQGVGKGLSSGELGNHMSHFLLWSEIAKDSDNNHYYLISEDDVTPVRDFEKRLKSTLYHAPEGWEVLFLYSNQLQEWGCHHGAKYKAKNSERFISLVGRDCIPGTVTYLIRPQAAKKFVEQALPFKLATDVQIKEKFMKTSSMKIYVTYPELVQTEVGGNSSILNEMGRVGRIDLNPGKKYLFLEIGKKANLASSIQDIIGAQVLSEQIGRELVVGWSLNKELSSELSKSFIKPPVILPLEVFERTIKYSTFHNKEKKYRKIQIAEIKLTEIFKNSKNRKILHINLEKDTSLSPKTLGMICFQEPLGKFIACDLESLEKVKNMKVPIGPR